jgi:hypothetical protein
MDIRPRNLRDWLPQVRLWPTPRYPMRNWNSPHGIKSQLGERTSGPTQTKIQNFPSSKSQLYSRQRLHRNPSPTHPSKVGRLPDWIPGTLAALLHNCRLVTKKQDDYVTMAATAPWLRKRLIKKSKWHDPFLASNWQGTTFDDIDWKSVRSSFGCLTKGWQFKLSKYAHNWTPTLHQWATQDNSIDWCCFACGAWREDIDHVLRCPSNQWAAAWDKAKTQFLNHLTKYYTPAPRARVIMAALDWWLANLPPALVPCLPTGRDKSNQLLHKLINDAFNRQTDIGWGHLLRGHLSLHWKKCIAECYKVRQPGDTYNPKLWMTKTVDAIWDYYLTIWTARNGELYGKDYDKQRAIAL